MQETRFNRFIKLLRFSLFDFVSGSWRNRSINALSILSGFYLTNNLISYFLDQNTNSVVIILLLVLIYEFIIRFRQMNISFANNFFFKILNGFRIGSTFALVLEAFKLGS